MGSTHQTQAGVNDDGRVRKHQLLQQKDGNTASKDHRPAHNHRSNQAPPADDSVPYIYIFLSQLSQRHPLRIVLGPEGNDGG